MHVLKQHSLLFQVIKIDVVSLVLTLALTEQTISDGRTLLIPEEVYPTVTENE